MEGNLKAYRLLVLLGGILLMVGAALPWVVSTNCFTASGACETHNITGWERGGFLSPARGGLYSGAGGGILVLIALMSKGRPGRAYSIPAVVVAALCGLLCASQVFVLTTTLVTDVSFSPGFGLLVVSPLGALLGIAGGMPRVPQAAAAEAA